MTVQKDIQDKFGKLKGLLEERQKALTAKVKALEEEKLVEIQNASRCAFLAGYKHRHHHSLSCPPPLQRAAGSQRKTGGPHQFHECVALRYPSL